MAKIDHETLIRLASKPFVLLLGACVLLVVVMILAVKPKTYGDVAREMMDDCIRQGDRSQWQVSPLETLERFCERASALAAIEAYKRDHPESRAVHE